MSSLQTKMDRAIGWMERENDRSDAVLKTRPGWWHAGKILFGVLFVLRAIHMTIHATGLQGYALAAFFFAGGLFIAHEGWTMLRNRQSDASSSSAR